jgi:catechol 2,3-dioxygenase-like lactoylglutathione lyase family enzyme
MAALEKNNQANELDPIDHIAISVKDIKTAVEWYTKVFKCEIEYEDETWAFLKFGNVKLALVISAQHPPHIAFVSPNAAQFGRLKKHRDGTESTYVKDPDGNSVEVMAPHTVSPKGNNT